MKTFPVPAEFDAPGSFAAVVTGDCMAPRIPHGAVVILHPVALADVIDGHAYSIRLKDGRWFLKQVWRIPADPKTFRLWCHNHADHPEPWQLPIAAVASIGHAVAVFVPLVSGMFDQAA